MTRRMIHRVSQNANSTVIACTHRATSSRDRGGVIAEYGLLIASVFIAAIGAFALFGEAIIAIFFETEQQYSTESSS